MHWRRKIGRSFEDLKRVGQCSRKERYEERVVEKEVMRHLRTKRKADSLFVEKEETRGGL